MHSESCKDEREGTEGRESQRRPSADLRHFATRLFTDTVRQWQSFSTRWWSEEASRPTRGIYGSLRRDPNVRPSFWKWMGEPFLFFFKMKKGRIDLRSEGLESLGAYPRWDLDLELGTWKPATAYICPHKCYLLTKAFKCTSHFLQHLHVTETVVCDKALNDKQVNFSPGGVP